MHLTRFQICLWLIPTCIEIVIVVALTCRKLWRDLPIFGSYIIFEIARTCVCFSELHDPLRYFYTYWITEALGCLASLWVIKELFNHAFARQLGLRRLGNVLFQWSIAVLLFCGVLIASISRGGDTQRLMAWIYLVKRTQTFVEAGLLAVLLLFAFMFGMRWHHYATGICLGFGVYGAVELSAITVRAIYGPVVTRLISWLIMSGNTTCVLIWAVYLLAPQPEYGDQNVAFELSRLNEGTKALFDLMRR